MEPATPLTPRLSVIVPALLGYDTVLAALDAWDSQSVRDQLEIIVLCPAAPAGPLPPGQVALEIGSRHLHQARFLGIVQARAEWVVLAEDHCLPDPPWAEMILARLTEGWDAVGPALRAGKPHCAWTQAPFLLGYGQWMMPELSGPVAVLPGHNGVLRKQPLMDLGPELEGELLVAAFLLRRLHREGKQRFYLEAGATMRHFDAPDWKKELRIFYSVGMGFGAVRTARWPGLGRGLYWLATPAVAARHWWRALTHYRRAGAQAGFSPACLGVAGFLAVAWAMGESAGAALGVLKVTPRVSLSEIKPVSRADL